MDKPVMIGHRMELGRMGVRSRTVKNIAQPEKTRNQLLKRADTVAGRATPKKRGYDHTPHEVKFCPSLYIVIYIHVTFYIVLSLNIFLIDNSVL